VSADRGTPGFRLKVARAREHVAELKRHGDAWLATDDYTMVSDEGSDRTVWRVRLKSQPPAELSLLVGDAVHNLRAALDHVVYFIAEAKAGTLTPTAAANLQFPIVGGRASTGKKKFEKQVRDHRLDGLTPNQISAIESWQPYRWDDYRYHWLWFVHDLDRIDKHRRLAVAAARLDLHYVLTPENQQVDPKFPHPGSELVVDGQELVSYDSGKGASARFERSIAISESVAVTYNAVTLLDRLCGQVEYYTLVLTQDTWGEGAVPGAS
jgi:hypothetical protein